MHVPQSYCLSLTSIALLLALPGQAQSLLWKDSLTEARASAATQGKLILLLAGNPACGSCVYMKTTICEKPEVQPIIDEIYVAWFADIYSSTDCMPYTDPLGPYWSMPLTCMIDPGKANAALTTCTGIYTPATYASILKRGARLCSPQPSNLVCQQVIDDIHYQVIGHIWTNAEPTGVFYRVDVGTNTANAFTSATGTSDWIAPLAPYLAAGASSLYTFRVYARFVDGSASGTNEVVFSFDPAGTPLKPRISSIGVANGAVRLMLTNLTAGATNWVERSLELGQTNCWIAITNLVGTGCGIEISEDLDPAWGKAFYRVFTTP